MSDLELPFRLPMSCVRIAGTRAFVHDSVLGRDDQSALATVTLDVVGEHEPSLLRIAEGLLVDTGVAFDWTDDGRLVTSSVELTGRAGAVAVGAVSAGAAIGGALLGSPAMALSCAGAATATAHRLARGPGRRRRHAGCGNRAVAPAETVASRRAGGGLPGRGRGLPCAHPDEGEALDACADAGARARPRPDRCPAPRVGRRRRRQARGTGAGRGPRPGGCAGLSACRGRRVRRALSCLAGDDDRHAARELRVPARARHPRRCAGAARPGRRPAALGRLGRRRQRRRAGGGPGARSRRWAWS